MILRRRIILYIESGAFVQMQILQQSKKLSKEFRRFILLTDIIAAHVDRNVQAPTILTRSGVPVTLIGKVADIVANDGGESISCVPTPECMELTCQAVRRMETGFICTNVQETDLAGHSQDTTVYRQRLEEADAGLARILPLLTEDDILLVQADHGNDPSIGHSRHTRENVPLLVYRKGLQGVKLGVRSTMSDVGATVCDFFGAEHPQNGTSFLPLLGSGK